MDPLIILVIVIFAALFFVKWKMPVWIGRSGEKFVSNRFSILDQSKYIVLNDLMLPSQGSTSSTQIDHVVVSNYGIFCIETKSYQGWIFGSADQQYWTQVIYRNKQRFYNPLRQNFAHIKAIESLLGSHIKEPIISFVIFPDADKLKISGTDKVGYPKEIVKRIQVYNKLVYSDAERDFIVTQLVNNNISDKDARRLHVKEVKKNR